MTRPLMVRRRPMSVWRGLAVGIASARFIGSAAVWSYFYWPVDQQGQVIDVYVSQRRDNASARTFFAAVLTVHVDPTEPMRSRSCFPRSNNTGPTSRTASNATTAG